MQKYYYLEWPDSQGFCHKKGCIQSEGMSCFVPCELYDKQQERELKKVKKQLKKNQL